MAKIDDGLRMETHLCRYSYLKMFETVNRIQQGFRRGEADRMQHHAWLETYIHHHNPMLELTFRNLGFAADELKTRPRSANFGTPNQWLTKCEADVIFCFFGYNEALKGEAGLPQF